MTETQLSELRKVHRQFHEEAKADIKAACDKAKAAFKVDLEAAVKAAGAQEYDLIAEVKRSHEFFTKEIDKAKVKEDAAFNETKAFQEALAANDREIGRLEERAVTLKSKAKAANKVFDKAMKKCDFFCQQLKCLKGK